MFEPLQCINTRYTNVKIIFSLSKSCRPLAISDANAEMVNKREGNKISR